jgi:hypothetical protein
MKLGLPHEGPLPMGAPFWWLNGLEMDVKVRPMAAPDVASFLALKQLNSCCQPHFN